MWKKSELESVLSRTQEKYGKLDQVRLYAAQSATGFHEEEAAAAARFLPAPRRVLVLGCGSGRECFALARLGHCVTGVDFSSAMLKQAESTGRELGLSIQWLHADATRMPPSLVGFDAVLFTQNLYSLIPSKRLRVQTLRNLTARLEKGGILLVWVGWLAPAKNIFYHNPLMQWLRSWKRRFCDPPLKESGDALFRGENAEIFYYYYFQRPEEIAEEFQQAGLCLLFQEKDLWVLRPEENHVG